MQINAYLTFVSAQRFPATLIGWSTRNTRAVARRKIVLDMTYISEREKGGSNMRKRMLLGAIEKVVIEDKAHPATEAVQSKFMSKLSEGREDFIFRRRPPVRSTGRRSLKHR